MNPIVNKPPAIKLSLPDSGYFIIKNIEIAKAIRLSGYIVFSMLGSIIGVRISIYDF